ncbi:MAG: hypothetical protein ABFE07_18000 [Armatimonadia bacterium]
MAENTAYTAANVSRSDGIVRRASGKITFPATAITAADYVAVECGFIPKRVIFMNITDGIRVEHYEGMTADTCIKTAAAGTVTLETTNKGITLTSNGFQVSQNATLAVIAASKVCHWVAEA